MEFARLSERLKKKGSCSYIWQEVIPQVLESAATKLFVNIPSECQGNSDPWNVA
jgi:hypothetical protein